MRRALCSLFALGFCLCMHSQDSLYTREVIKFLTSKKCFGRGYLNNGLENAEKFIVSEIKKSKTSPLFKTSFTQPFTQQVNVFPKKCKVKLNGKTLVTGIDFIPDPASGSASGKYKLEKKDSVTFVSNSKTETVIVKIKKKLTYSVAAAPRQECVIELEKGRLTSEPSEIEVCIKNKVLNNFTSRNIGCVINGTSTSDTMLIFTAHYDHLGGLGKSTFFAGANDNASGVSVLLNLIKHYSATPRRYKTVFVFFAGEEAGLLGSKFFVENSPIDLSKIRFLINLDLLGTGDDGIMVVNGAIHTAEYDLLNRINDERSFVKEIKKRGKAANSDHYWFSEKGVPAFFIYTMGGVSFYHDVLDVEKTLPLTDYKDVFRLITEFSSQL